MSLEGMETGRITEIYNVLSENPDALRDAFLGMAIGKKSNPKVAEMLEIETSRLERLGLMADGEMPRDVRQVVTTFVAAGDDLDDAGHIVCDLKPLEL